MIFLFEGGVSGAGCFLKFESTWVVKDIRLCIPFTCTLKGNSILHNRLLRIHFELSCQHVWKETNMFTICILSWIKQIPGDNTQKRDSCLQWMSKHELIKHDASFTVRSQGHNFPSQKAGGLFRSDVPSAHSDLDEVVHKI